MNSGVLFIVASLSVFVSTSKPINVNLINSSISSCIVSSTKVIISYVNNESLLTYFSKNAEAQNSFYQICNKIENFWCEPTLLRVSYIQELDNIEIIIRKHEYDNIYEEIKEFEKQTVDLRYTNNVWITLDTDFASIA